MRVLLKWRYPGEATRKMETEAGSTVEALSRIVAMTNERMAVERRHGIKGVVPCMIYAESLEHGCAAEEASDEA